VSPPSPAEALIEVVLAVVRQAEQLCLVRRSAAVGSGQGQWSMVMGYLDPDRDPVSQAWIELLEEIALAPPALELVRALPPVDLTSRASGRVFRVHPFLFESSSREVTLNWEHDAVDWVDLARLSEPDCVRWQLVLVEALLAE
jgi:8-oxo-dGTP pyrophosphatase MutT (NUDIX family)